MIDQNQIFEMTKKDMIKSIEDLSIENVSNQKELIMQYFSFIESLLHLIELKNKPYNIKDVKLNNQDTHTINEIEIESKIKLEDSTITSSSIVNDTQNDNIEALKDTLALEERKMYLFERKTLGGYIPELNAIVPEQIVVRLGLEHSDYVYAHEISQTDGYTKKKYHYEFAKKGQRSKEIVRIQYNLCPVEKDGTLFVVRESYDSGSIRINDVPQSLVLWDQDIQYFGLEEGQLVDVAYIEGKENAPRVIYKHPFYQSPADDMKQSYKKKSIKEELKKSDFVEQTLDGKTVLVVGNEPDKSLYRQNVEGRGGTFLWADGKDPVNSFEPLVRKSDVVVYLLAVSGHTAMKHIKKLCKEYEIPFMTTFNISSTTIIRLAESLDEVNNM